MCSHVKAFKIELVTAVFGELSLLSYVSYSYMEFYEPRMWEMLKIFAIKVDYYWLLLLFFFVFDGSERVTKEKTNSTVGQI